LRRWIEAEQLAAAYTADVRARLLAAQDVYDPAGVLAIGDALRQSVVRRLS
jgi:hypothetical protein